METRLQIKLSPEDRNALQRRAELGQDDISRYVDAVFCFANERNRNVHATYSVPPIGEN